MREQHILDLTADTAEGTERVGELFAAQLVQDMPGEPVFLAMYGDLGAGKTTFIRGMARVLTPDADVSSPTYALVNEYRDAERRTVLYHFDMYRITGEDDLYSIGFFDYFDRPDRLCPRRIIAAEWSENIAYALPARYYRIVIEKCRNGRRITISAITENE